MINVNVIAVGKLKEKYLINGCEEYIKRLGSMCKINVIEIDEYKLPDNPSTSQIEQCIEKEGKKIEEKIPKSSIVIPMCIEGNEISSVELSQKIQKFAVDGASEITFVIGGSYGLWTNIKEMGNFRLSMSKMTFPHQLARMMLLEQIYRAFSIDIGNKYHK
ncbi:MAG: 23S rRNA (pseudouridine(1915)-N(3))-methyltransferase RlmH [Oscillospiraceae bacterium]